MTDKSYVSVGISVCPVCLKKTDDCVLLDTRLQDSLDRETVVDNTTMCPDCQDLYDKDFIAMVEVSNLNDGTKTTMKQSEAERTGRIMHIKLGVLNHIINAEHDKSVPMAFISEEVFNIIKNLYDEQVNNQ